jgi:two-component system chemotaxis response regulator CheV
MSTQTSILLESDTNELEIVEFRIDERDERGEIVPCYYGVNVAKVREILRLPEVTRVVTAPPGIEGMIKLRDKVIPIINLAQVLNKPVGDLRSERVIVLEFNSFTVGVLVQSVSRIYRFSWKNVEPPTHSVRCDQITGLVKFEDRIILVLDFEKIVGELCQESALRPVDDCRLDAEVAAARASRTILVADDSSFIRASVAGSLRRAGYTVEEVQDGAEAWEYVQRKMRAATDRGDGILSHLSLLITDVEMPQMDGLHLTSLVRKTDALAELPVIIFSSLASEDNRRKWTGLGANRILTKPDLPNLVAVTDAMTAVQLQQIAT